jgi:hypothetical protein
MRPRTPEQVAAEIEVIRDAERRRRTLMRSGHWRELFAAGLISTKQAEWQAVEELHNVDIFAQARAAS